MNKAKQAQYGRIGGLKGGAKGGAKTGPTKRRDVDYAALGRKGAAKRKQLREQSKCSNSPTTSSAVKTN